MQVDGVVVAVGGVQENERFKWPEREGEVKVADGEGGHVGVEHAAA